MSFAIPQTPQRPLPGAYLQTPSNRPGQADRFGQAMLPYGGAAGSAYQLRKPPVQQDPTLAPREPRAATDNVQHVERAARTINDVLRKEARYPELDSYVTQGVSSEYDISSQPAWTPFQRVSAYDIPDKVFDQYNKVQLSTLMGLFADLSHAWVAIDNALYLWDYTQPDPPLIGFEEQPKQITTVTLAWPREGVFVSSISRLLVVATTSDVYLVGVSTQSSPTGNKTLSLYSTGMQVHTKGIDISVIAGSASTGRVFFAGRDNDDIYELTYQQEEKWFQNKCSKINHTGKGFSTFTPAPILGFGTKTPEEHTVDIRIDDSRALLYTLSSRSTIRVFHMTANNGLNLVITRPLGATLRDISHMPNAMSPLLSVKMSIVSIDIIASQEATRMHLIATTSTGCRIFMSATSGGSFYSMAGAPGAPTSMQVQHVKFPPPEQMEAAASFSQGPPNQMAPYGASDGFSNTSKLLSPARKARRQQPGYFFCVIDKDTQTGGQTLFISAPDSGRIARPPDASRPARFPELGMWVSLGGPGEDIGSVTKPFAAARTPLGFANELALQFDTAASEVALMTNTGIHTYRRRRLVDIFASVIKVGGGDEGLEAEIKKFIRRYGRGETASTALAVACGQGADITADARVVNVTDPEVLEFARRAFIEYGGKPQFYENNVLDHSVPAIDMVHPSPRHEGLSLYVARLVISIWSKTIVKEETSPKTGLVVSQVVPSAKLQTISQDLLKLKEFIKDNKSFIEGLSGPEALDRATTKQEEISLQAEHRALHSQVILIDNIIEGIAFVQVLFEERIGEIVVSLAPGIRESVRTLTYEALFSTTHGKDLAKELVKAIVNRNIANGSNVESVAEALRRRCGSFCSPEDVVIFKAQEQLKRASEAGQDSELGRNLLNEGLRLFLQVASSLTMEQLHWAMQNFTNMQFYAAAIQLALAVAHESDRANRALSWIEDGRPENDARVNAFNARKRAYDLVHEVITAIEQSPARTEDGPYSSSSQRKKEAYEVIDTTDDEAFQTDLFDWYLAQQKIERILDIQSPYIVTYLERRSGESLEIADLLWRHHSRAGHNHQAAEVQLELARSSFHLSLDKRVEYLGRAKANASMPSPGISRQARYQLQREASDLLDIANVQDDVYQRLMADTRVSAERRPAIAKELNGQLLPMNVLYNDYADQAGYFDLCIMIYQAADHRNPADIRLTWQNLLERTHEEVVAKAASGSDEVAQPFEVVAEKIRSLGTRLGLSDSMFPIPDLLPMLERYAYEYQRSVGSETWVIDTFVDIGVPYESLYPVLEGMFYSDEQPFHGRNRRIIASDIVYLVGLWFRETSRGQGKLLGGADNAAAVSQMLLMLQQSGGLDSTRAEECAMLRMRIEHMSA